ncbi:MAG: SDR family oxidoreductase [Hyphomonadaceae bacterium]|nr:SDR family oxidoreductase [Hyphomonadaceae bacterium]GIK48313.1 MAG: 3-oxoacyl-ACP reductase [Alphaproteobacteria bacterium]
MTDDIFRLDGRTILVTGGANGLGRMIAEALLGAGARVLLTSRKDAETAAAELSALGPCEGVNANLATPEAAVALAEEIRARTDKLHVLINNAGRTWGAPFDSYPDKAWAPVMTVNVHTPFILARELKPLLQAAGKPDDPARILNIGSIAGRGVHGLDAYAYSASKAALHHLTREIATELAPHNIAANVIIPGWFPTDMTAFIRSDDDTHRKAIDNIPLKRFGTARDIGGTVIFLSSQASAYITGAEIALDGGVSGCR